MTIYGEEMEKTVFVLEHITTIEAVKEDWDLVENKHWWSIGFHKELTGYRFRVNLGADFLYIKGDTLEKAEQLRVDLIKRLSEIDFTRKTLKKA